jgi:soluble lytic murein transglycosylase-like protein
VRFGFLLLLVIAGGSLALAQGPPAQREHEVRCAEYYARMYDVPLKLVEAVIDVESDWNPHAVSPKGAVGLMQLMPETAFAFRVRNRFEVEDNIRGGVAYLAWLIQLFRGDLRLVIAAYIAGPSRILARGLGFSSREVYAYEVRVANRYRERSFDTMGGGKP